MSDEPAGISLQRLAGSNSVAADRERGHHNQQRHHCFDLIHATGSKPNMILETDAEIPEQRGALGGKLTESQRALCFIQRDTECVNILN